MNVFDIFDWHETISLHVSQTRKTTKVHLKHRKIDTISIVYRYKQCYMIMVD
jgi:hypothetical protein